jgi:hypothetical protein
MRHGAHGLDAAKHVGSRPRRPPSSPRRWPGAARPSPAGRRPRRVSRPRPSPSDHRHMGRGHHRELAAGHVAAHGIARGCSCAPASRRAAFRPPYRSSSDFCASAKRRIWSCAKRISAISRSETFCIALRSRCIAQAEGRGRVAVEFLGQFAHRRITARLDIAQDALDRRADLGVILRPLTGRFPALEILRHDRPPGGKWPRITGAFPIRASR